MAKAVGRSRRFVRLIFLFLYILLPIVLLVGAATRVKRLKSVRSDNNAYIVSDAGLDVFGDDSSVMSWEATAGFIAGGLTFLSICLVAAIYSFDARSERQMARREIYQRLELASIELFRFECEHAEMVALLWEDADGPVPPLSAARQLAIRSYVFQMLNLFEMSIRFREQDIMEPDVFGSWIIWMYELCSCKKFQDMWQDLRLNYVGSLQLLFADGIKAIQNPGAKDPRQAYFEVFARHYQCAAIRDFIKMLPPPVASQAAA